MLTSSYFMGLRKVTRKLGLNKLVGSLISNSRYEDRFGPAFKAQIQLGDMVWDIGANLGLYTAEFLEATGAAGHVVAFEPTEACFAQLHERFSGSTQVTLKNIAVGEADGALQMAVESDPLAATHRIVIGSKTLGEGVSVLVRSAASLISDEPELFPNIVKIDVEGHEGAVLDGFDALFSDKRLHCIGIEVHFGLLDERGESARPKQMEKTLINHGFVVRWTDPSHLLATR